MGSLGPHMADCGKRTMTGVGTSQKRVRFSLPQSTVKIERTTSLFLSSFL